MSQGVGGVGGSGSVSGVGSLGTCTSVNFVFAKLQMELAASAKDSALGYIKQIEGAQAEQKEVADMLRPKTAADALKCLRMSGHLWIKTISPMI